MIKIEVQSLKSLVKAETLVKSAKNDSKVKHFGFPVLDRRQGELLADVTVVMETDTANSVSLLTAG